MKDPRAFTAGVVLAGAAAVFAALGWSAFRLATLPAVGASLEASGLPRELDLEKVEIAVDEAHGTAWLVGADAVCALDLATARALGCQAIAPSPSPPRVLAAGPDLFVVTPAAKGPPGAIAFDWLVLDASARVRARGNAGPNFPSAWATGAALLNLAWDPDARAASIAFTWNEEGVGHRIVRVPIRASGIGEPSVRRVGDRENREERVSARRPRPPRRPNDAERGSRRAPAGR